MKTSNRHPKPQAFARHLRKNMTDAERHLWRHLRGRQLHGIKFRRQQAIGGYVVDFVSMDKGLIIELDGGQHAQQEAYDAKRSAFLQAQGYRILRFWNHEVLRETPAVLESIWQHCQKEHLKHPHPNPPPQAGEGTVSAPRAGQGTVSAPRAGQGTVSAPRAGQGTASAPRAGQGTASAPHAGQGTVSAPHAGHGTPSAPYAAVKPHNPFNSQEQP